MFMNVSSVDDIENIIKTDEVMLLKFDNEISKYNDYFNSLELKVINIVDQEIINFYDIETLPTILIYKNKNLLDTIEGFYTKSILIKKILNIIDK